jgi:hypothetical protein
MSGRFVRNRVKGSVESRSDRIGKRPATGCKGRQVANDEIAGVEAQQLVFADE